MELDALRRELMLNFPFYASQMLKIRDKSGSLKQFILNREQLYLHDKLQSQISKLGRIRAIILKGRQQGISTYVEGRLYWRVTHSFGSKAFILTHHSDATRNIFEMAQRYHALTPDGMQPTCDTSNAQEMYFEGLDSGYKVGTAGNKGVGRSQTIQYFHGSEVAFWPHAEEHAKGILEAVADVPGTEIFLESTANGTGNFFYQKWQQAAAGASDYIPIFIPWFWHKNYTRDPSGFKPTKEEVELADLYGLTEGQLFWRRMKIADLSVNGSDGERGFKQEYPCNAIEAFQTSTNDFLIRSAWVERARKCDIKPTSDLLVIGVDCAHQGNDATAIIRRRDRVASNLQRYYKKDPMQIVGILKKILDEEKPIKMFIDLGNAGAGIVSRLHELGYRDIVEGIYFGQNALDEDHYFNKRAEMWGLMSLWYQSEPVSCPDDDSLHADVCSIQQVGDSLNRLKLEPKEAAARRIGRSPDSGDALALTFAKPVTAYSNTQQLVKQLSPDFGASSFFGA